MSGEERVDPGELSLAERIAAAADSIRHIDDRTKELLIQAGIWRSSGGSDE